MKITYLLLKNFKSIKNCMKANEIEIDFSQSINKICLIIGPNGSGKTSLLSLMHPFATIGNLDVRDKNDLILKGKDGYKEIHIESNSNYYIIKHFYSPTEKSHTVKSFIEKNGTELNINGNVTSFKEYVKIELGIELDYMTLIRIGSNVTSLISKTETERKTFMSKLLDELNIYLMYYKKVSGDLNKLKEMISHDIDKVNRLNITNKKDAENEILGLEASLQYSQEDYGKISGNISVFEHEIEKIKEPYLLKDKLNNLQKKITKMDKILSNKDELESTDPLYYNDQILRINTNISQLENSIATANILIQTYLDQLDNLNTQLRSLDIQLSKELQSDDEINKMTVELSKMMDILLTLEKQIDIFDPPYTKEEVSEFIVFIKNSQQTLFKAYEFGKTSVNKVIELLRKNRSVVNFVNIGLLNLDDTDETSLFLQELGRKFDFHNTHFYNCEKENVCYAKSLWVQIANIMNSKTDEHKDLNDLEYYKGIEAVYSNIIRVLQDIGNHKELIEKLPQKIKDSFKLDKLYTSISNLELIYNEKDLNYILSDVTDFENYKKIEADVDKLRGEIERYKNTSHTKYIKDQIKIVSESIDSLNEKIERSRETISECNEKIIENKRDLEIMKDLKETFEKYDMLVQENKCLTELYSIFVDNTNKKMKAESELAKVKMEIGQLNSLIQEKKTKLLQYTEIKKELKLFNRKFEEMTLVKDAHSSKKGIPLHYITNYLGDTINITNELLDIAYDGRIYIDKFDISATSFLIPWFNDGTRIDDVKYASQGELSFLSVALSFALASQAMKDYNIMLLDEIDGPLDIRNREKFIRILENQIERIGSEQNFLITHNDMFSSYPIDIIDLGFDENQSYNHYRLANYIKINKKK